MKVKVERGELGHFFLGHFSGVSFYTKPSLYSFPPEVRPKLITASHVRTWLACGLAHGENELKAN